MRRKIPLTILGGSDKRPAALPDGSEGRRTLSGCKGTDIRLGDRTLIEALIERLEACGGFGPIRIAGPSRIYREAGIDVEIIDTDAGFGENIRAGVEAMLDAHGSRGIAMVTCDVLPEVDDLEELVDSFWRAAPCDLLFPFVRAGSEDALGASDWKPRYRVVPEAGEEAVSILPGHLAFFDPSGMRLDFLYRLFGLAYKTRNRPIRYRRTYMLRGVLGGLLRQDLLHVLGLRLPTITWDVAVHGVRAANRLRLGTVTRAQLEDAVRRIFVKRKHRRDHPQRRVRFPITSMMSLARDIDTLEEARAIGATATSVASVAGS